MPAKNQKPQVEVPEEVLIDQFVGDDEEEDHPVVPQAKPETVSEVDWVAEQTDVPIEEDDDQYS